MYKYITQKLFCEESPNRKCFVLEYDNSNETQSYDNYQIQKESKICSSSTFGGLDCVTYDFTIDDVKIIVFSSNIGMIALNLHFLCDKPDYRVIANSIYFMKKISNTSFENIDRPKSNTSWLSLAKSLLYTTNFINDEPIPKFCFYSEEKFAEQIFLFQ